MAEDMKELLQKICACETASYPVIEMEKVINLGEAAVPAIISCLKEEAGFPHPEDDLPLLVMLGEIRSPKAIDILIKYLRDVKNDITAEVACEGLAKIGIPAIPSLKEIVTAEKNDIIRLYAYAALGYIRNEEAHEILITQLEMDRKLASAIALALSRYKKKEDAERIYRIYQELTENIFNPDIEESIWFCVNPAPEILPIDKNWRVRYRRLPHHGWSPAINGLGIMAIAYKAIMTNREGLRGVRKNLKRLSLDEILSQNMIGPKKEEFCEDCKKRIVYQAGLPICPDHTAYPIAVFQEEFIKAYLRLGYTNVPEILDLLDDLYEETKNRKNKTEQKNDMEKISMQYITMYYFIERRTYSLQDALRELSIIKEDAEKNYKIDFGSIMQNQPKKQAGNRKIGRNEPCPCESGKKYKKCCGAI